MGCAMLTYNERMVLRTIYRATMLLAVPMGMAVACLVPEWRITGFVIMAVAAMVR